MGAAPLIRDWGAFAASAAAMTISPPASYVAGDTLLLLVSTANQAISTPGGWTQVANSPQGTGTAGAAGGIRLYVFWKIAASSESAVSISDSGSYQAGQMFSFSGADPTSPIHVTAGDVLATADTLWTCPAVTTTVSNCLIVNCAGNDRDASTTNTLLSSWTNPNLTNSWEYGDATTNTGAGGGIGLFIGKLASPGDSGTTYCLSATAVTAAFVTIALAPQTVFGVSQAETTTVAEVLGASSLESFNVAQDETAATGESSAGAIPTTAAQDETAATSDEYLSYKKVVVVGVVNLSYKDNDYSPYNDGMYGVEAITVPDGADFCVLFHGSRNYIPDYTDPHDSFLMGPWPDYSPNHFEIGGQTLSLAARSQELDELIGNNRFICDVAAYVLAAPPLGEQVFSWGFAAITDIHYFSLVFYANVHQTDPLVYMPFSNAYFRAGATVSDTPVSGPLLYVASEEGGLSVGAVISLGGTPSVEADGQTLRLTQGPVEMVSTISMLACDFPGGGASQFDFSGVTYAGYLAISLRRSVGELHRAAQTEAAGDISEASIGQDQTQYVYSEATESAAGTEDADSVIPETADSTDTLVVSATPDGEAIPSGAELTETVQVSDEQDGVPTNESNDRWVGEGSVCTETITVLSEVPADLADTLPVRQINGPYVDIPTEMMFSDSRSYQYHNYVNTASGGQAITIHANTNLLVFAYHTRFSVPEWIQEGNYILTLNGVSFVHLANTNAAGFNVMVAYVKNPESGNIVWNFPNPNFGGAEEYADVVKICQFSNVDVSGDPFRSVIDPVTVESAASLTLSGISFNEGDMVVGIEYGPGGAYGNWSNVGRQPNLTTGGVFNEGYGWSISTTVGAIPWGASSITASSANEATRASISMMALVLKVKLEGWVASPAAAEAGSLTPADTLTSTSEHSEAGEQAESVAVAEASAGVSSNTEEGDRADSVAAAEVQVGAQGFGGSDVEELVTEDEQSSERAAYGMGYAWAIVRVTQNGWKVADCLRSDALTVEEVAVAGQGTSADMAAALTIADVVTAYAEAGALMSEIMAIAEASSVTQVLGGSISEAMQVVAQATTTAEMYAATVEAVIFIDQWLAEVLRREIKQFMAGGRVTSFLHRLVDLSQFLVDKKMLEFDRAPTAREFLKQEKIIDHISD